MQDKGFNSFISNMTNLSVNETKWSSLLARTRALILYISIWMCVFGPEKLPGLSRKRPLGRIKWNPTPIPRKRQVARRPRRALFQFLIWWKKDLLILRLFFPRLGTRLKTLKDRYIKLVLHSRDWDYKTTEYRAPFLGIFVGAAQWLGSPYWRATEPLNHDWRGTEQTAEPLKYYLSRSLRC